MMSCYPSRRARTRRARPRVGPVARRILYGRFMLAGLERLSRSFDDYGRVVARLIGESAEARARRAMGLR